MERIMEAGDARTAIFVQTTPEQLREALQRFELAITQRANPGEAVYFKLTRNIILFHEPHVTATDLERRAFLAVREPQQFTDLLPAESNS